jgi:imidazole glycerol-phosphate synthase subunit HisF
MVKKRLVASLIIKDGLIVQSFEFKSYLPIGRPRFSIEHISRWDIDEIILLDISASRNNTLFDVKLVEMISKYCNVPLTVGGGIKNVEDATKLIRAGADKICINTIAIDNKKIITELADNFGSQAVIVSIDAKEHNGNYRVFSNLESKVIDLSPKFWAKKCEALGAGEIFLNSIDRDGSRKGYDSKLIKQITKNVKIPVIVCGGVGKFSHFTEGFKNNVSAVAASNIFHHIEHSTILAKASLLRDKIDIRLDSIAKYSSCDFDDNGRLMMMTSKQLEQIEFKKRKYRFL